jgi:hypothetical protein
VTVQRNVNETTMQVNHYVEDLLRDYKWWGKSKLNERSGELDLLQLLTEYTHVLLQDYGNYMAEYFFPLLIPVHEFAAQLTKEVRSINSAYQMVICDRASGDGVEQAQFTCAILPENVFGSLNIKLVPK